MSDDEINILDNTCQTTRSIIPDSFDWETVDLMPTPSCQTPITLPWQALAEAFSHQPSRLGYDDDGRIGQNGTEYGYLYMTGVIPSF